MESFSFQHVSMHDRWNLFYSNESYEFMIMFARPIISKSFSSMFFFFQTIEARDKFKMTIPNLEVLEMK